jgi:hypothetical protein
MGGTAGYSGTPLARKLGLKSGMRVRTFRPPEHYPALVGPVFDSLVAAPLDLEPGREPKVDFVHLFATAPDPLARAFAAARSCMEEDGMVWASWPKKSSGVPSEIGRSEVMAAGKAAGLVDVKVCAIDDVWSGLKFMIPVERRLSAPPRG